MAKLNSAGTGSRRNTPQPIAQYTRTKRTTRSQSREDSEPEHPKYSERVQRKPNQAGVRSANQGGGQSNTRGSKDRPPDRTGKSVQSRVQAITFLLVLIRTC